MPRGPRIPSNRDDTSITETKSVKPALTPFLCLPTIDVGPVL